MGLKGRRGAHKADEPKVRHNCSQRIRSIVQVKSITLGTSGEASLLESGHY